MQLLLPSPLQQALEARPPIPKRRSPFPHPPKVPFPRLVNVPRTLLEMFGMVLLAAIAIRINRVFGTSVIVLGVLVVIVRVQLQLVTYRSRWRNYRALMDRYFQQLESYAKQESQYEQSTSAEGIKTFRRSLIISRLLEFPAVGTLLTTAEVSPEVRSLMTLIQEHLPGTVTHPQECPDLLYVDPQINLHLAIALDQVPPETERWLDQGWVVVVFPAEEVMRSPHKCLHICQRIADLQFDLL